MRAMDVDALVSAVQSFNGPDAFRPRFTADQWRTFAQYLTPHRIRAGDLLIQQGDADKTVYFIADGSLQVFVSDAPPGSSKVAILRAGATVGEPALFADVKRTANVEAMTPCEVWALRGPRLDELAQRSPALALALVRAAAGVMAVRLAAHVSQRVPMT